MGRIGKIEAFNVLLNYCHTFFHAPKSLKRRIVNPKSNSVFSTNEYLEITYWGRGRIKAEGLKNFKN